MSKPIVVETVETAPGVLRTNTKAWESGPPLESETDKTLPVEPGRKHALEIVESAENVKANED